MIGRLEVAALADSDRRWRFGLGRWPGLGLRREVPRCGRAVLCALGLRLKAVIAAGIDGGQSQWNR